MPSQESLLPVVSRVTTVLHTVPSVPAVKLTRFKSNKNIKLTLFSFPESCLLCNIQNTLQTHSKAVQDITAPFPAMYSVKRIL